MGPYIVLHTMDTIFYFLERYDWIIYIVGTLGILLYLTMARQARREHKYSIFALEREEKANDARRAFLIMLMFVGIVAVTAYINFVVLPSGDGQTPAAARQDTTPTPLLVGPTLTPEPTGTATAQPTELALTVPTATQPTSPTPTSDTAEPSPTPAPAASPTQEVFPPSCPNPGVRIVSPGMNQAVSGSVNVVGTAKIDGFQFYKVEFAPGDPPQDDAWTTIQDVVRQPVENGVLITFPAGAFPSGTYWLRLVVVDQTGNFPPPCQVRVRIPAVP